MSKVDYRNKVLPILVLIQQWWIKAIKSGSIFKRVLFFWAFSRWI